MKLCRIFSTVARTATALLFPTIAYSADCLPSWEQTERFSFTTQNEVPISVLWRKDKVNNVFISERNEQISGNIEKGIDQISNDLDLRYQLVDHPDEASIIIGILNDSGPVLKGYRDAIKSFEPNELERSGFLQKIRISPPFSVQFNFDTRDLTGTIEQQSEQASNKVRRLVTLNLYEGTTQLAFINIVSLMAFFNPADMQLTKKCEGYSGLLALRGQFDYPQPDDFSLLRFLYR